MSTGGSPQPGFGNRALKVKLGSPEGLAADQSMFSAVAETLLVMKRSDIALRVDANGGWDLGGSRQMIPWLAERGVEYIEQPLPVSLTPTHGSIGSR